ncbi:MAG: hypothetical protein JO009_03915 [Candidatus Eremiobacteraeota bacterium]|nr:hypothetical protein [Candidatus Eremiobacteraeota bacterium]
MDEARIYRFKIDAYTPTTMPMARLAEYIVDLANLLGEHPNVHLIDIDEGSTVPVVRIDFEAAPKVLVRVDRVRRGDGEPEAMTAERRLNQRLREDNGRALLQADGAEILQFPGRDLPPNTPIGAFNQDGTLDGRVIAVGGKREWVPVHLNAGQIIYTKCIARRSVAKRLAHHIFTDDVRLKGTGRWLVDQGGNWTLDKFTISDFELLDNEPLTSVVAKLRAIEGAKWDEISDPWAELVQIRGREAALTNGCLRFHYSAVSIFNECWHPD